MHVYLQMHCNVYSYPHGFMCNYKYKETYAQQNKQTNYVVGNREA